MDENSLLVIENTGIYHRLLWAFCCDKKLPIHIGNSAHIKWSFGIARGKRDRDRQYTFVPACLQGGKRAEIHRCPGSGAAAVAGSDDVQKEDAVLA